MLFFRYKLQHIKHDTTHTLFQFITTVRDTCWCHNKMAQCQIFLAQTALVHHVLCEIRISYLYIWYNEDVRDTFCEDSVLHGDKSLIIKAFLIFIKKVEWMFRHWDIADWSLPSNKYMNNFLSVKVIVYV